MLGTILKGLTLQGKFLSLLEKQGFKLELVDINVENLVPPEYRKIVSSEEFMKRLPELDAHFDKILNQTLSKKCRLRYIASFNDGVAEEN